MFHESEKFERKSFKQQICAFRSKTTERIFVEKRHKVCGELKGMVIII